MTSNADRIHRMPLVESDATGPTIELALPVLQPVRVDAGDSALIIIDMQNEYMSQAGRYYMPGMAERAVDHLSGLTRRCRELGIPIIHVQSVRSPASSEFRVFGQGEMLIDDTWNAEIFEPLRPEPGEFVVRKRSNDCFVHTVMQDRLDELGLTPDRSQVMIAGCATHGCAACAVIGFSVRRYRVLAVEDCMAANTPEDHVLGFRLFAGPAYAHNVVPTSSALLEFVVSATSTSG